MENQIEKEMGRDMDILSLLKGYTVEATGKLQALNCIDVWPADGRSGSC